MCIFSGVSEWTPQQSKQPKVRLIFCKLSLVEGSFSHFWAGCLFCASYLAFVSSELTAVASLLLLHPQSHLLCVREHLSKHRHLCPPFWGASSFTSGTCRNNLSEVHGSLSHNSESFLCSVVQLPIQKCHEDFYMSLLPINCIKNPSKFKAPMWGFRVQGCCKLAQNWHYLFWLLKCQPLGIFLHFFLA